jgi:hypothetical protein
MAFPVLLLALEHATDLFIAFLTPFLLEFAPAGAVRRD